MIINNIDVHFTPEQKDFMRNFFELTSDFLETEDMLNPNVIDKYVEIYRKYLSNSEYKNDELLNYFIIELKQKQLIEKMKHKNSTLETRIRRLSVPVSMVQTKCQNEIINKWQRESTVAKVITRADTTKLNNALEPKLKQNAKERKLSWKAAHKNWVGK